MNWLPSEHSEHRDPVTGHWVGRWTSSPSKDQHLYFTSPSVYAIDRPSGRIRALTCNARGLRLSYSYPWGGPTGLSKGTSCLDPVRWRAFAVIDDHVWQCAVDAGTSAPLAALLESGITSFTHVSPDGRWLCVPVTAPTDPFLKHVATRPLYAQRADEQCGHENFDAIGNIVYHGHQGTNQYLARHRWDGTLREALSVGDLTLHHATPDGTDYLVDCHDGLIQRVSRGNGPRCVTPLCQHGSDGWEDQDNHVHPVATGHGSVVFTSRRAGAPDVYEVFLNGPPHD
jgi:hypothetical protein